MSIDPNIEINAIPNIEQFDHRYKEYNIF